MTSVSSTYAGFNSILSLQPLVKVLKRMIEEGKPGAKKLYEELLIEVEKTPALLEPVQDVELLNQNKELAEALLGSIFPPSTTSNQGLYAITYPFSSETIYASPGFKKIFLKEGTAINVPDKRATLDISKATLLLAYHVILNRLYDQHVPVTTTSVHAFTEEGGLTRYYELKLNAEFVDVTCCEEKDTYTLPTTFSPHHALNLEEMQEFFPLEYFQFEGIVVINVSDVTSEQTAGAIKTALLNINAFSEAEVFEELQQHVQSLIGIRHIKIGITPFFKKNSYYLYTDTHYRNSLLFKNQDVIANKDIISQLCQSLFHQVFEPVLYHNLEKSSAGYNELVNYYLQLGAKSLILCPLQYKDGGLIGLLEIMSEHPGRLSYTHLSRVTPTIELFRLALEKTAESLEAQIDKTIKEHFTAIQPAVEWKFTEAAFHYMQHQSADLVKMQQITFEDVYPLYGAIDVRNSSLERTNSIQLDLIEQLTLANEVLNKACKVIDFPLLKETQYRIEKYMSAASDTLLSDDEMQIYDFLQVQLDSILQNLLHLKPELKKVIGGYYAALDAQRKMVYHHRKEYEDSITRINDVLDRFTDQEQRSIQEIYPHYFERYITDGVEFNIYVGQSLSPQRPFNEIYVRNLKLWQLTFLAKAARLTASLEKRLPLPLQTTQLILAHSVPLSISFRRKERKFDVDGAYNIRYEIIKKRIDKVHLRDSDERLTQPGRVAIVYSQHKELAEYSEYIEFLQNEGLLGENVEHLDLEDTQGISGLKAVRVDVNFTTENTISPKEAFARVGSDGIIKR